MFKFKNGNFILIFVLSCLFPSKNVLALTLTELKNSSLEERSLFSKKLFLNLKKESSSLVKLQRENNEDRDRFNDITGPQNTSLSEYFNGNKIDLLSGEKFVATQMPMNHTKEDFYKAILEHGNGFIINLFSRDDYEKYDISHYENFSGESLYIHEKSQKNLTQEPFIFHEMELHQGKNPLSQTMVISFEDLEEDLEKDHEEDKSFQIYELEHPTWLDFKATGTRELIKLVKTYKSLKSQYNIENADNKRSFIHCRAGVGRTGTFMAMYDLAHIKIDPDKDDVEKLIKDVIMNLRKQRGPYTVQTKEQIESLVEALIIFTEA